MTGTTPSIKAELVEGYQVEISNGSHIWGADEPGSKGGTDTGPTPYEMLLGSLAACTCITLSMYAARKGIALEGVSVGYTFERVHADDVEEVEDLKHGYIEQVTSEIEIRGDFTEAERKRLQALAVRCPVHKTLDHGLNFEDNVTLVG